ncbi:ADP-ribosyltransferase domain-containing protein [Streptomyces sp. B3I8]|uniref:ADP-ribosyltransferase domain-containing protein n=1 Tax=Streptomyces sp. B3I8 TaxID=3042303 RepID=UPI0027D88ABA|nr:ADP-ribosyltransferase domain-containing protein [Streptomyces sp. B3I8]
MFPEQCVAQAVDTLGPAFDALSTAGRAELTGRIMRDIREFVDSRRPSWLAETERLSTGAWVTTPPSVNATDSSGSEATVGPALRLRGGAPEAFEPDQDIVENWLSESNLPLRRRSPRLQEIDRALADWMSGGRDRRLAFEQNTRELRAVDSAIGAWLSENQESSRLGKVQQLRARMWEELEGVSALARAHPYLVQQGYRNTDADRRVFRRGFRDYDLHLRAVPHRSIFRQAPEEDVVALVAYTGITEFSVVNAALRQGDTYTLAAHEPLVKGVISALNHFSPHIGTVYRGIMVGSAELERVLARYAVGRVVQEPTFVSADSQAPRFSGNIQFEITSRTGRPVQAVSRHRGTEAEVIFLPGTSFEVLSREQRHDTWFIKMAEEPASRDTTGQSSHEEPREVRFAWTDSSSWRRVGEQLGSNPGGTYLDHHNRLFYVKTAQSHDHARNEVLAAELYRTAGLDMPALWLVTHQGKAGIASPLVHGARTDLRNRLEKDPAYRKAIQNGFAVDAWLANWDVAGTAYDNIVSSSDGRPVRIDAGGTLLYRARGDLKGSLFGAQVNEWETLRNPSYNAESSYIFSGMSTQRLQESARRVLLVGPGQIDSLVDSLGFKATVGTFLKDTLKVRRADVAARAGIALPAGEASGQVTNRTPTAMTGYYGNPNFQSSADDRARFARTFRSYARYLPKALALAAANPALQGIPHEDLVAVLGYTGNAFFDVVNKGLREQDAEVLQTYDAHIRGVVSGLNRLPVYRGTVTRAIEIYTGSELDRVAARYPKDATVEEKSFVSADATRLSRPGNIIFTIESETGRDISLLSDYQEVETEVTFPPGTTFKVTKNTKKGSTYRISMREVPRPRTAAHPDSANVPAVPWVGAVPAMPSSAYSHASTSREPVYSRPSASQALAMMQHSAAGQAEQVDALTERADRMTLGDRDRARGGTVRSAGSSAGAGVPRVDPAVTALWRETFSLARRALRGVPESRQWRETAVAILATHHVAPPAATRGEPTADERAYGDLFSDMVYAVAARLHADRAQPRAQESAIALARQMAAAFGINAGGAPARTGWSEPAPGGDAGVSEGDGAGFGAAVGYAGLDIDTRGMRVARDLIEVPAQVERPVAARTEAARLLGPLLRNPAVAERVADSGVRVIVIPRTLRITDLPEFSAASIAEGGPPAESRGWTDTARGLVAVSEENLLGEDAPDPGRTHPEGYSSVLHEAGHLVHAFGLDDDQRTRADAAHTARLADGAAEDSVDGPLRHVDGTPSANHSSADPVENFAQATVAFFGANHGKDATTGRHRNNGPGWLAAHDPTMYALLLEVYGEPPAEPLGANALSVTRADRDRWQALKDHTALVEAPGAPAITEASAPATDRTTGGIPPAAFDGPPRAGRGGSAPVGDVTPDRTTARDHAEPTPMPAVQEPSRFLSQAEVATLLVEEEYTASREVLDRALAALAMAQQAAADGTAGPCDLSVAQALARSAEDRHARAGRMRDGSTT